MPLNLSNTMVQKSQKIKGTPPRFADRNHFSGKMTFQQKMATNERTSRPASHEISENFKCLMSFAMGCSFYWAGNMSLRASAPSTENIVRSRFFSSSLKLMDDWPPRSTSRLHPAYGGLWYFAERGKLLPWCRSDNMLDNGG